MLIYLRMAGMALAVALLVGSYFYGREAGIKSAQGELRSLREQIAESNADALLKAQEAAKEAKRITDEAQRAIDQTKQLVSDAEAARAADAGEYRERLRAALSRSCGRDAVRGPRVPPSAGGPARPPAANGLLLHSLAGDLQEFAGRADRVNDQFAICYAAVANRKEVFRRVD